MPCLHAMRAIAQEATALTCLDVDTGPTARYGRATYALRNARAAGVSSR